MPERPTTEITIDLRTCRDASRADPGPLGPEAVHVWQASQEALSPQLQYLAGLLSAEERTRADRFRFEKDHNQFVTARGLLRLLLAGYVGADPKAIEFGFSDKGKPSVAQPERTAVEFNIAHSGDRILLAFSRGHRVGVDVEKLRTDFVVEEIAERFFSQAERQKLKELSPADRHDSFFRCWTRKEAYIKATGDGLSLPLHQFDVSLSPGERACLLATRPLAAEAERWLLFNLDVGEGYAAALVVEKTGNPMANQASRSH